MTLRISSQLHILANSLDGLTLDLKFTYNSIMLDHMIILFFFCLFRLFVLSEVNL